MNSRLTRTGTSAASSASFVASAVGANSDAAGLRARLRARFTFIVSSARDWVRAASTQASSVRGEATCRISRALV